MCLNCEDKALESCAMVPRLRFLATFCVLYFQRAARSTFLTCILNSHCHTMCQSMVDIQSPTAEIRRGEKKKIEVFYLLFFFSPNLSGRKLDVNILQHMVWP